jgi:hypothetical protein
MTTDLLANAGEIQGERPGEDSALHNKRQFLPTLKRNSQTGFGRYLFSS